jgi:hypothetical protein
MSQQTSITTRSSDTSDSGSDTDDFPDIAELRVTPSEAFYNQNNQSMKCLVVLCEGLKDVNGDDLLDIQSSPFSSLKRGDIKPTADMFRGEVVRRHQLKDLNGTNSKPRPKNWTMDHFANGCRTTPSRRNRTSFFKQELYWTGNVPYLRLIHFVYGYPPR